MSALTPIGTTSVPAGERSSDPSLGIGLLVLAELLFATMDTVAKQLSLEITAGMVVWGRSGFHSAFMQPFVLHRHPPGVESGEGACGESVGQFGQTLLGTLILIK